jgi:hypothetical protein
LCPIPLRSLKTGLNVGSVEAISQLHYGLNAANQMSASSEPTAFMLLYDKEPETETVSGDSDVVGLDVDQL